jgi:hypothetical protein
MGEATFTKQRAASGKLRPAGIEPHDEATSAGARSGDAIDRDWSWLSRFPEEKETQFALRRLLDRSDLGARSGEAIDRGLSWLSRFLDDKDACFVLGPLLGRADLGARSREAIERGLAWLERFQEEMEAGFVLAPLLGRLDLGERSREVINRGLAWLSRFPEEMEAGFVLPPLLGRPNLGKRSGEAIERALSWLSRFPLERDAGFVLPMLLERAELGKWQREETVSRALDWLDRYHALREPDFIFKNLFKSKLEAPVHDRCVRLALRRAEALPFDFSELSYLLRWVLESKGLTQEEESRAVQLGLAWCELHPFNPESSFLMKPILRRKGLSDGDWSRALRLALAWLQKTPHAPARDYLFLSCLNRPYLLADADLSFLRQDIFAWCRDLSVPGSVVETLRRALRHAEREKARGADPAELQAAPAGGLLGLESAPRSPLVTVDDLFHWFKQRAAGPPVEILEAGIAEARSRLEEGRPGSARYYLAPLLPLTARWGSEAQAAEVRELTRSLLSHPGLQDAQRAGFVKGSLVLLEGGAWADKAEAGRQILRELGVTEEVPGSDADAAGSPP